jgi:hypothetical protein
VVADIRIDLRHAVDALEAVELALRKSDREPVENGREAPLHGQVGHALREARFHVALDGAQRSHLAAASEGRGVERKDRLDEGAGGRVGHL